MNDIRTMKKAIADYIRQGYMEGSTSPYLRDVLTCLRDMPECSFVSPELDAAVAKLVGQ